MHVSLDQALGRQPRLNRVGQSLLNIGSGASAAYSLRSLTGGDPKVVNARRDGDDDEREFTSTEVGTELADWVNGKQETALPADLGVASFTVFDLGAGLQAGGVSLAGGASLDDFDGTFTPNADGTVWTNGSSLGVTYSFGSGSWVLSFNDGNNVGSISISSTTKFPFQVTNWGSAGVSVGAGASGLDSSSWSNAVSSYLSFVPLYSSTTAYPTAEAAYSFRKIRSTYTGHAVRIRRSSDNVEVNVSFDTNDEVSTSSPIENTAEEGGESGSTTATTLGGFLTEDVDITSRLIVPSDIGTQFVVTSSTDASNYTASINNDSGAAIFPEIRSGLFGQGRYRLRGTLTASSLVGDIKVQTNGGVSSGTQSVAITSGTNNLDFQFDITGDGSTTSAGSTKLFFFIANGASATLQVSNLTWEVTAPDAAVHTWYDQSGNSNNATQGTAAAQPLFAESGSLIDSGKSLSGEASLDHHLDFGSSITVTGDFSIFYKSDPNARSAVIGPSTGTTPRLEHSATNTIRFATGTNYDFAVTGTSFNNAVISLIRDTSDSATLNQNGTLKDTKTVDSHSSFTFGQLFAFGSNANQLDGKFSEIIIYNFDQSNNRFKIESNMNNHYEVYTASQNGFVHTWFDQSGNSKDARQSTLADQPQVVKSGNLIVDSNSNTTLEFDGGDLLTFTDIVMDADGFSVFSFCDSSVSSSTNEIVGNSSNSNRIAVRTDAGSEKAAVQLATSGNWFPNAGNIQADDKVSLHTFIKEAVNTEWYVDGTNRGTDTTSGSATDTTFDEIGKTRTGVISEVIIYKDIDKSSDRTLIEGNMNNYYESF